MSHPDQPVEISHEDLHLGDTKHWNNQGRDHCNGSQNSEPLGEYGNNTCDQKCKSDEYTKEHMNLNKANMEKPVQQSKCHCSYPGKESCPHKDSNKNRHIKLLLDVGYLED